MHLMFRNFERKALLALICGCAALQAQTPASTSVAPATPAAITLDEAIKRAQRADSEYASAYADSGIARADQSIAGAALLPGVTYHNQYLYTQPQHVNSKPIAGNTVPIFIANNAVHEYTSQGVATENIGAAAVTDYAKSKALAAVARARLEIARRGLVATVVGDFYGVLAADAKLAVAQRALDEAQHFGTLSKQLEQGGEVAHFDTIKANLQISQRSRDLGDAQLEDEKARLDLGVLLFDDPRTAYTLTGDLVTVPDLPQRDAIKASASTNSAEMKAALEAFHAASLEVTSTRFNYLPSLSLNYTYGIDATQFAATSSDGIHNLGYAAYATLDIPVWDWFTTRNQVRQSELRRDVAKTLLTNTERHLVAELEEFYREASTAKEQLASLDQSVVDAREALRLTNLRYTSGEAPALEVVDAQNTLLLAESSRADGAVRYYTALANLQTLTGNMP